MIGRRVYTNVLEPGDFYKAPDGVWYACCPTGKMMGLQNYQVTENEKNGLISVRGEVFFLRGAVVVWHGFLTNGVWSAK